MVLNNTHYSPLDSIRQNQFIGAAARII